MLQQQILTIVVVIVTERVSSPQVIILSQWVLDC